MIALYAVLHRTVSGVGGCEARCDLVISVEPGQRPTLGVIYCRFREVAVIRWFKEESE